MNSLLGKNKFLFIFTLVIIIVVFLLSLLSKTQTTKTTTPPITTQTPSPAVSPTLLPLTSQNANEELEKTDSNIQSALNQFDKDLTDIDRIETAQDIVTN